MPSHAVNPDAANTPRLRPTRIVGRYAAITRVVMKMTEQQFVTIVGPGGMGKTALARAFAYDMRAAYPGGIFRVTVGALDSPEALPAAVSAVLGVSADGADPWRNASRFLSSRQALVILDGCEHLLLATAAAAERLRAASDTVSILATSREALRADGEWIYRISALTLPGAKAVTTREEAEVFTAVQLFLDRVRQADPGFDLEDAQAQVVCDICRRLDGIPLALELAAAQVVHLGLAGLAAQIGDRLGWRDDEAHSLEPHHGTLGETLDWSHHLLSDAEKLVLRRLSVFRDVFDTQAAIEVAGDARVAASDVIDGVMGLSAKSLLSSTDEPDGGRYRLLDTTRDYASRKLQLSGEYRDVSHRHAEFVRRLLAEADAHWSAMQPAIWNKRYSPWLDDVRHALDWGLSDGGEPSTIVALALGGFGLTRQMGAELEFKPSLEAVLGMLQRLPIPQPLLELQINKCINSISYVPRDSEEAQVDALQEALETEEQDSNEGKTATLASGIAMLCGLFGAAGFLADYPRMNEWFNRIDELARDSGDGMALLTADRIRAQMLHWGGAHAMAVRVARRILDGNCFRIPFSYNPSPIDLRVSMRIVLARALWMQGFADRAAQVIAEGMRCALEDSPLSQCQVIAFGALPLAIWSGDDRHVDDLVALLEERASQCSIGQWGLWAREFSAVVAEQRGESLPVACSAPLGELDDAQLRDHLCTMRPRRITSAQLERVLSGGGPPWCAPEILRAHADHLLESASDEQTRHAAEALLRQSLGLANAHGALAWELRAAMSLGRLLRSTSRSAEAHAVLAAVLRRFKDSFATGDFIEATRLAAELSSS